MVVKVTCCPQVENGSSYRIKLWDPVYEMCSFFL